MSYYYNAAGRRLVLPERPLELQECWAEEDPERGEEEYDRAEDEMDGKFNRLRP